MIEELAVVTDKSILGFIETDIALAFWTGKDVKKFFVYWHGHLE